MIKITVYKSGNFPVNAKRIREYVENVFLQNGISSNAEASIAILSHKKLVDMAVLYMKETPEEAEDHPVLSFPTTELEGPFVFPPDETLHIGEIAVSYDKALEVAKQKNILIDEAVCELAEHGALHLVGVHHK